MNAVIRKKIQDRLAKAKARQAGAQARSQSKVDAITEQILVDGETPYTILEVVKLSGYSDASVRRHLKGRPGWLRGRAGGIRIARSLARAYIKEQVSRGVEEHA